MDYKVRRTYHVSKVWLILTILVFSISYILMQVLYSYANELPDFDIALLSVSYITPIILCFISLTLTHFQKRRLGALFGIIVGINLITNIAFTDIIINSAETFMDLFKPIFSLLPILDEDFGDQQFNLIKNIVKIVQVLYGVFLIIVHIPALFKRNNSVFNDI